MNIRIGGSDIFGGSLIFEVSDLTIFAGYVTFREESTFERTCKNNLASEESCKLETLYSDKQLCLTCKYDSVTRPKIVVDSNGQVCDPASTNNPKRTSFYTSRLYHTCPAGQYAKNNQCENCFPGCLSCSSNTEIQCISCPREDSKYFTGWKCEKCSYAAYKYLLNGQCKACSKAGCGCLFDRCQTDVCQGTETYFEGKCCNIGVNQAFYQGQCKNCHHSCETCYKTDDDSCSSCKQGFALNKATSRCMPNCDSKNGKFWDGGANMCSDCSEGCLECLNASICSKCDSNNDYYLKPDNRCYKCPVGNKKYMDKVISDPPSCLDCIDRCLVCQDEIGCIQCEDGYLYDGAGKCIPCSESGGFALIKAVVPYLCLKCHSSCKIQTIFAIFFKFKFIFESCIR